MDETKEGFFQKWPRCAVQLSPCLGVFVHLEKKSLLCLLLLLHEIQYEI